MRGKLRDKRSLNKHDGFHREESSARRPYKRATRTVDWIDPVEDENYEEYDDMDELEADDELRPGEEIRK